jgi:hypothetical protein
MHIPVEVKDTIIVAVDSIIKTSSQKGFWDFVILIAPFLVAFFAYWLGQRREITKEQKSVKRQKADQYEFLYEDFKRIRSIILIMWKDRDILYTKRAQIDLMPIHILFQNFNKVLLAEKELLDNYFSMYSKITELNQKMGSLAYTQHELADINEWVNYTDFIDILEEIKAVLETLDSIFPEIAKKYGRD